MATVDHAIKRREFCAGIAATVSALAPTFASCDGSSPTSPTSTASIPVVGSTPPTSPPSGTEPVPPPTSNTVETLPMVPSALVDNVLRVPIGSGSTLSEDWASARTQFQQNGLFRDVLLTRTTATSFTAVNAVCTHEGCNVSLVARPVFVCPCHGSRYDHHGAVVRGPAPAALPRFNTEFVDGVLLVRV